MSYDVELFCRLFEIFPASFEVVKSAPVYDYENSPWGQEKVCRGTEEITLAGCILDTAKAISREGSNMAGAFKFLNMFRKSGDQKRMIQKFMER